MSETSPFCCTISSRDVSPGGETTNVGELELPTTGQPEVGDLSVLRFGATTRIEAQSVVRLRAAAPMAGVVERSTFVPAIVKRVANVALPPATISRVRPLPDDLERAGTRRGIADDELHLAGRNRARRHRHRRVGEPDPGPSQRPPSPSPPQRHRPRRVTVATAASAHGARIDRSLKRCAATPHEPRQVDCGNRQDRVKAM